MLKPCGQNEVGNSDYYVLGCGHNRKGTRGETFIYIHAALTSFFVWAIWPRLKKPKTLFKNVFRYTDTPRTSYRNITTLSYGYGNNTRMTPSTKKKLLFPIKTKYDFICMVKIFMYS